MHRLKNKDHQKNEFTQQDFRSFTIPKAAEVGVGPALSGG